MSNLNNASGVVSNTDFKALLGSAISLFIPVKAIYQCLGYIIPIKIINLVVSIVIRIKSFIPSMGENDFLRRSASACGGGAHRKTLTNI